MPTQAELKKAQPLVVELMAPAMAEFKEAGAKDKTAAAVKVADKSVEFANAAETEAAKFLLLKGAVSYYVRGEAYDKAADAVAALKANVKDVTPTVIAEITGKATGRISETKAPRLFAAYRKAKLQLRAAGEAKTLAQKLKKVKSDALQRRYAEALAVSGDWKAAYAEFAKLSDAKLKAVVEAEASGKAKNAEAGKFWWAYEPAMEDADDIFKEHAAVFYRQALAADEITGLKKNIVEQRIKPYGDAVTGAAGGQAASPRTSAAAGLYCVIDLSGGPDAKKYPVSYLNDMPKGGWSDEYKTTKLVLRRIEPGAFMMGEKGKGRHVAIKEPYYMGVFEVTQKQWSLIIGDRPSFWKGPQWSLRPVEQVSFERIRGKDLGSKWPESDDVDEYSFMWLLRQKTGLRFDLPTEAQWEYACRAGTMTIFHNNCEMVDWRKDPSLDKIARYQGTGGWNEEKWGKFDWGKAWTAPNRDCGTDNGTAAVGSYQPNNWGLYDTLGNVAELCLDYENATNTEWRVVRGGYWTELAYVSTAHWRGRSNGPGAWFGNGVRLCLPLAGGAAVQTPAATSAPTAKVGKAWQEKGNEATLDLGEKYGKLEFVKCPAGDFKQIVDTDGKMVRVQISRPFWIMKKPITARQTSVGPGLGEWEHITRSMTDILTAHLTNDFEKDLPRGMVVRLPTLAEWEYAFQANTRDRNSPYYNLCKGREGANWKKVTMTQVNAWGMSCFGTWERVLDVYPAEQLVQYGLDRAKHNRDVEGGVWFVSNKIPELESKKDPLSWAEGNDSLVLCRGPVFRSWFFDISRKKDFGALVRLVIGPDLVSEWKTKHGKK